MAKSKAVNIEHPGLHLLGAYIVPLKMTITGFAEHIGISRSMVSRFVNGKTPVTPYLAFLLGKATRTEAIEWLERQTQFDLAEAKKNKRLTAEVKKVKVLPGVENL